jgi:Transmembrane domain of unknown function (DUF3566)
MDETPPTLSTTKRVKRIAPLQLGKIMGLCYGIMGLCFCPIFLVISFFAPHASNQQGASVFAFGTAFALLMPVFYGVMGFVLGIISAFVYNIIAKWIGGIEVEVE